MTRQALVQPDRREQDLVWKCRRLTKHGYAVVIQLRSTKVLNVDLQYPPASAAAYFEHGSDIHV